MVISTIYISPSSLYLQKDEVCERSDAVNATAYRESRVPPNRNLVPGRAVRWLSIYERSNGSRSDHRDGAGYVRSGDPKCRGDRQRRGHRPDIADQDP